jgi:uncharacterized protein YjbK
MNSNIEIESKILLEKDEYEKIIEVMQLDNYRKFKQTNHYMDTPDSFLKNNGIALRVREKNQEFELTLKTPLSEGLLEKNENLSWKEFDLLKDDGIFPDGGIKKFLAILGADVSQIKIMTSLTTERIQLDYRGGILCVDKNYYSNQIDYELEFEYTSITGAQEIQLELLKKCGIKNKSFNHVSKQARAFNALKK